MSRTEFLDAALKAAVEARDAGAPINPVIAAAQAALESNWGQSQLAREANNLKGVKTGSSWDGPVIELPTREWREADGAWYTTVARWRKYRDWQHSFEDYGDLINRLYPNAANNKDDPAAFLGGLLSGQFRYATDPLYFTKVWSIVEQYNLLSRQVEPEPEGLLIVFDADNNEVLRLPIPTGGSIVDRQRGDRRYIRVERPE